MSIILTPHHPSQVSPSPFHSPSLVGPNVRTKAVPACCERWDPPTGVVHQLAHRHTWYVPMYSAGTTVQPSTHEFVVGGVHVRKQSFGLSWSSSSKLRLLWLVVAILAAAFLGASLLFHATQVAPTLPQATYRLEGLSSQVVIRYDATGMPHVTAQSEQDGYAGLCWAEAHDRLFQLDELRRAASGRLAEILGAGPHQSLLQQDEVFRTLGLVQLAQAKYAAATPPAQADMNACARGINAVIAFDKAHHALPLEFSDLRYSPEVWQPWQSEVIGLFIASSLDSSIYLTKIERAAITGLAGPQVADALVPDPPDSPSLFDRHGQLNPLDQVEATPTTTAASAVGHMAGAGAARGKLAALLQQLPAWQVSQWAGVVLGGGRASNAFAVDGTLSASGKPLLASDPHLALTTPSFLYLAQVTVNARRGFNFEGLTFPGFPVFISGHNEVISYGVTFGLFDDVDLYAESVRATARGEQVLFAGRWVSVHTRQETFQIAGASPITLTIRTTPHGPILNDAMPDLDALGTLAMKTTLAQAAWTMDGFFALPKARTWQAFRAALAGESVGLNFLYADMSGPHGHIGYQLAGLAPQRDSENTLVPVSGGDGSHEWTGYAAPSQLPAVFDPPQHILETSNNRIVPSSYAPGGTPVYISRYFDLPWRAERATSLLLQAGNHITPGSLTSIQLDTQTTVGKSLAADLVSALEHAGLPANDPSAAASLSALETWDGTASATSIGATIYEVMIALLDRDLVTSLLGPGGYQTYTQAVFITTQLQALQSILASPTAPFFGATKPSQAQARRDQAVRRALEETDALLRTALGTNQATWAWGRVHQLTYNHPLASMDSRFNIGAFPVGGDGETVDTGGFFTAIGLLALPPPQFIQAGGARAAFAQDALATGRVVWNMRNFDASLGILSTGESGDPRSSYWSDQAAAWRAGQYNHVPFSRLAIDTGAGAEIVLS